MNGQRPQEISLPSVPRGARGAERAARTAGSYGDRHMVIGAESVSPSIAWLDGGFFMLMGALPDV
jgi:hypothetical protein